jgi:hypothetical protein
VSNDRHSLRSHSLQGRHAHVASAFAIAFAVPVYYALRGGSYDIVVRQEEAIVVWLVVGLGYGLGVFPRSRLPRATLVPLAAIGLLAAWTAIGFSWTDSDERTLAELARVLHYAGVLLLVWGLVDRTTWQAAAGGLALAAIFIAGMAVASRLAPGPFPTNYIKRTLDTDRLNYPFDYWNALGAWSVMAIAMTLSWSAHARTLAVRAASGAALPVCGLAVYLTYSRAGAIGSGLALLLVLVLARNRWVAAVHAAAAAGATALAILTTRDHDAIARATGGEGGGAVFAILLLGACICIVAVLVTWFAKGDARWRLPTTVGRVATAAAVLAVGLVVITAGNDVIARGWDDFRGVDQETNSKPAPRSREDPAARLTKLGGTRYFEWKSALRAFEDAPVKGVGAGTFEYWWNRDDGREFVRDAHSFYFESLGELGIPGLAFGLLLFGGLAAIAVRTRRTVESPTETAAAVALGAAFLVFLFHAGVDWMWESTAVTVLALACGALSVGALGRSVADRSLATRLVIPAIALVALLVQVPGLVSTSKVRSSQEAAEAGEIDTAFERAGDAVQAQPWAASPYVQRGLLEESTGQLAAATVDLRRAVRYEPTNWRPRLLLARVEAKRGRVSRALADYRTARDLRPRSVFFSPSVPSTR